MEKLIIWFIVGGIITVVFVPYFIKFRKTQQAMLKQKKEAQALGIDRPRAQFPLIDSAHCIGCGSCIAVCPEGDVIGIVNGTATIVNAERCVGHGYCEQACPVGALKVGLGDTSLREDIPIMNEFNETTVPGLYIAGELGGLSLIRNAIAQGRIVVEQVAKKRHSPSDSDTLDLIIVGAGPAGLSAALTAIENRLSYVVLDELQIGGTISHYPKRKLVMTQPVEIPLYGWLKQDEYSKETLMEIWSEIVGKYGISFETGARVESVVKSQDRFQVRTTSKSYYSHAVVLAMGRRGTPRKLDVPGEELPKVMYKLVDAGTYTGLDLLVVGGGDSAVEAAIGLARQPRNRVTLSYRKSGLFRIKKKNETAVNELIQTGKITALFDSQVTEIDPESVMLETKGGSKKITNDFVFVFIGGVPPFEMLKNMGIGFGGTDRTHRTSTSHMAHTI